MRADSEEVGSMFEQASIGHEQDASAQRETFEELAKRLAEVSAGIPEDPRGMVTPFWEERLTQLRRDFEDGVPWDFLQNRVIRWTMNTGLADYHDTELTYLRGRLSERTLTILLAENEVGGQEIVRRGSLATSGNTIHHLHHIVRYCDATGDDLSGTTSILEWGGGFGSMARLFRRILPGVTYTIVDVGGLILLQWLYLSSVLGRRAIHLVGEGARSLPGKVNLVPLASADLLSGPVDLFVSTWAISESSKACQDWLLDRNVFDAPHFLMGRQETSEEFPFAERLEDLAGDGVYEEEISFLPGNYYVFR